MDDGNIKRAMYIQQRWNVHQLRCEWCTACCVALRAGLSKWRTYEKMANFFVRISPLINIIIKIQFSDEWSQWQVRPKWWKISSAPRQLLDVPYLSRHKHTRRKSVHNGPGLACARITTETRNDLGLIIKMFPWLLMGERAPGDISPIMPPL